MSHDNSPDDGVDEDQDWGDDTILSVSSGWGVCRGRQVWAVGEHSGD